MLFSEQMAFKSNKIFSLPQVRLELTTPALLKRTVYKYCALTDCATGANCYLFPKIHYCKVWGSNPRNLTIMRA